MWGSHPARTLTLLRAAGILQRGPLSSASMSSSVSVQVAPSLRSLFDEPVCISVGGLRPEQLVTLGASLTDEAGVRFQSRARYRAGPRGELDLVRSPSLGGSFTGLEPMGLLWALEPDTSHWRMVKKDVQTPFRLELEVQEGHGDPPGEVVAKGFHERGFLREGVLRIPVREGRLRATLFVPPGPGPFPAVIDLYGTGGGLMEYRASLLASRGFVTLALAYFGFEDLPDTLEEFHLDYFGDAVEFLQKQQKVSISGIGVLGISKGADLAISMATFLPGIKAAVHIYGCGVNFYSALRCNRFTVPGLGFSADRIVHIAENVVKFSEAFDDPADPANKDCRIPIEKSSAAFLFVSGLDDQNVKSALYCEEPIERLRKHGKEVEVYNYAGAGHLIEPPYLPLCSVSLNKFVGMKVMWGGRLKEHAHAPEDAWRRIQNFLFRHLSGSKDNSLTRPHLSSSM